MAAYVVFVRKKSPDAREMKLYWSKIAKSFEGHPFTVLAAYGTHQVLEGPGAERVVIAEFPSVETALTWYDSTKYQEAAEHRRAGAVYEGYLVLGVDAANSREVSKQRLHVACHQRFRAVVDDRRGGFKPTS